MLPFAPGAKRDNRLETAVPSERWARGKHFGSRFLHSLADHVIAALAAEGVQSTAPWYLPEW